MEEEKQTWADIMRGFAESRRLIDEMRVVNAENDAKYEKRQAEYQAAHEKRMAEYQADTKRYQAETAKYREEAEKYRAEAEKYRVEAEKYRVEADRRQAEYQAAAEKRRVEADKRQAEYQAAAEKRRVEADKRQAEYDQRQVKLDAQIAAATANINGISDSNGMFAEELFFNTLSEKKEFAGIHFDDVDDGFGYLLKLPDGRRLKDQFDIVMLNDAAVAIIEAKYKARKADVKTLAERKVENFKILFPAYKDFKIYLGLGALAFEDDVVDEARKYGVGLLRQVGNTIEYDTDWEVKAY